MRRVPEREAAKAAGERFYMTAKPCKNGHVVKRYTTNGLCSACAIRNTLKSHAKAPEHPARIAARAAGLLHFSIGKPCIHGHEDKRFVANGICVQCSLNRCAKWLKDRPGYEAAAARRRRAVDPTGHRAEVKRWARANKGRVKEALKAWKAANIEYVRLYGAVASQNRRARIAKNGGFYTVQDVHNLRAKQDGCCAACKTPTAKMEVDHIVAVIRGGSNDPSNLQLLCRPCNRSKGARDMNEWAVEHGYLPEPITTEPILPEPL